MKSQVDQKEESEEIQEGYNQEAPLDKERSIKEFAELWLDSFKEIEDLERTIEEANAKLEKLRQETSQAEKEIMKMVDDSLQVIAVKGKAILALKGQGLRLVSVIK